jgi:hypothetical protein
VKFAETVAVVVRVAVAVELLVPLSTTGGVANVTAVDGMTEKVGADAKVALVSLRLTASVVPAVPVSIEPVMLLGTAIETLLTDWPLAIEGSVTGGTSAVTPYHEIVAIVGTVKLDCAPKVAYVPEIDTEPEGAPTVVSVIPLIVTVALVVLLGATSTSSSVRVPQFPLLVTPAPAPSQLPPALVAELGLAVNPTRPVLGHAIVRSMRSPWLIEPLIDRLMPPAGWAVSLPVRATVLEDHGTAPCVGARGRRWSALATR